MNSLRIIFLIILLAQGAFGTIRYVSKTGSSTPPYITWETASDSIQKCLNICVDGDTIIVGNGIYREWFYVIKELTILGVSMDSTVVDATDLVPGPAPMEPDCSFCFKKKSRVENITLIGKGVIPGFYTVSILDCSVTIKNCKVQKGLAAIGLIGYFTNDILIEGCILSETLRGVSSVAMTTQFAYVIKDCLIITINDFGRGTGIRNDYSLFRSQGNIIMGKDIGYSGIHAEGNTYSNILNNFASGYDYKLFNFPQASGSTSNFINNVTTYFQHMNTSTSMCIVFSRGNLWNVRNNIIMNTKGTRPAIYCAIDTLMTDYNIFWKNAINGSGSVKFGESDLFADPMLVNDTVAVVNGSYDYHLQTYSPGIDAGDPAILDPDGTRSDIGMFGGPLGQIYQYQDLPPKRPSGIVPILIPDEKRIIVKWAKNSEADTSHYIIYKDTVSNFPMDSSHIFLTQKDTIIEDYFTSETGRLYYRIKAADKQGNMSEGSDEVAFVLTDEGEYVTEVKRDYHLYQNYPNPFNPSTVISYQLVVSSYVKVIIYDIKGEVLEVLVNENKSAGYYEVEFNAGKYASGIYLYRIEAVDEAGIPRFMDIKKMILIK